MFQTKRLRFLGTWGRALCLAALVPLLLPAVALAGNYGCATTYRTYYPSYSYSSYTPSYSYSSYCAPAVKVVKEVQKEYVPVAVKAVEEPDYYFSLKSYYQQKLQEDAAAWRVFQRMQQFQQAQQYQQPQQSYQPPQPQYQAPPQQQYAPRAPQYQMPPAANGNWESGQGPGQGHDMRAVQAVLSGSCLGCHGGQKPERANFSEPDQVPPHLRFESWARASRGDMPRGHNRLPREQVDVLYYWALSGTQARR